MATPTAGVLVSHTWALEHLTNPHLRFVEVDVDTTAYSKGHIPGAVAFNWTSQLQDSLRRDIVSKAQFEALCSAAGIEDDTIIVLYGDNNNWFAAYAFWILKLYGHSDVRIIDGGRKKWELEQLPLTTDRPSIRTTAYRAGKPVEDLRALRDDVLRGLDDPQQVLVDVRSPQEFSGEIIAPPGMTETAQRAGHIPGAKSVPWSQAVREDGTFRSPEELRAIYVAHGVTPEKNVVAYCRIGERSSHTWFVLRHLLGYTRVRNYDGSWTEWGSSIGLPIENPTARVPGTAEVCA
jgi:thiosulfate/3-mercaptopyruvate sulfurtransferase